VEFVRKSKPIDTSAAEEELPEVMARALDASEDDLRHDRTEDVRAFVKRMEAQLAAHLARKSASKP